MPNNHIIDLSDQQKLIEQALGERISREEIISGIDNDPSLKEMFYSFSVEDRKKIIAFLAGEQTLQILNDKFFKKILNPEEHRQRVEALLSAILGEKVEIIEVLPREGIAITEGGSQVIMDIILRLSDGSTTAVEMQRLGFLFPGERTSCYLSDMIMRQYGKVKDEKGKNFSYKDMKKVNLIVIMEKSSPEFRKVSPKYIHKRKVSYDSGVKVKSLENVIYISLDTFRERNKNKISSEIDAWLTFFTAERPDEVLSLLSCRPDFLPMYMEVTEFRKKPGEVIGMFSEALRIMDRNTTKYMIDELHDQLNEAIQEKTELDKTINDQHRTIDDQHRTIDDQSRTIDDQSRTIDDQNRTIDDQNRRIKELQNNNTEKDQIIDELRKRIKDLEVDGKGSN